MKQSDSSSSPEGWYKVTDPKQAAILSDAVSLEYFGPFVGRERTVSEAAREIGCGLGTMYYRVGTFQDAGLVEVTKEEKRAGRAIKHYRSVSDRFLIPFEVTPFAGLEERIEAQARELQHTVVASMAQMLRDMGVDGRRIYRGPDGGIWSEAATELAAAVDLDDPRVPVAIDFSKEVRLTREEARELQQQFRALRERYEEPDRKGRRYILQATLVPHIQE